MAQIKRFSSVQIYERLEYNPEGILSETTWTLLDKLEKKDGVGAVSSTIGGLPKPVTVKANPKTLTKVATVTDTSKTDTVKADCITVTTICSCGLGYHNSEKHTFLNHCPRCGRDGSLRLSWKRGVDIYHDQITCGGPPGDRCGADYCGVHGNELSGGRPQKWKLEPCPDSD